MHPLESSAVDLLLLEKSKDLLWTRTPWLQPVCEPVSYKSCKACYRLRPGPFMCQCHVRLEGSLRIRLLHRVDLLFRPASPARVIREGMVGAEAIRITAPVEPLGTRITTTAMAKIVVETQGFPIVVFCHASKQAFGHAVENLLCRWLGVLITGRRTFGFGLRLGLCLWF